MRTHDAWLIDSDGTLYFSVPLRLAMATELALFGFPVVRILKRFRREHENMRTEAGTYEPSPFHEQLRRTADALNVPRDEVEQVVQTWMFRRPCKWLHLVRRQSLLREIARFREEGGRTALVSDYPAQDKLAVLGAQNLFDRVVACGEEGGPKQLKPSPAGLLLAASDLQVAPSRCQVLGDREDADGAAARAASMEFRLVG